MSQKKVYFASDFHLGAPNDSISREREDKIIRWLDAVKQDAEHIYLVGDLFDFWFEYKHAIPKGFIRFQGKIAELTDAGIPVTFFTGNHDLWMFDYFSKELGVKVEHHPIEAVHGGKKFLIGHGDGLGPGDSFYKLLKKIFTSRLCQWMFKWLHPDIGIGFANGWSKSSRRTNLVKDEGFVSKKQEWLWSYAKEQEEEKHRDYYVFGHRHLPLDLKVNDHGSRYINLGEWLSHYTFAEFDGENLVLKSFETVQNFEPHSL